MHSFKGNIRIRGHIPFKYLVVDSVLDGPFHCGPKANRAMNPKLGLKIFLFGPKVHIINVFL